MTNINTCNQDILLEKDLYPIVFDYLAEKYCFNYGGTAEDRPISLRLFNSKIFPDIFGLVNKKHKNTVVMAEGKRTLNGREFDICKGQGITLQRFADFVYLFFPLSSWLLLSNEERQECISQCQELELGLLIVDVIKRNCTELCPPKTNKSLIKSASKEICVKAMVDLFPDFSMEMHKEYCKNSQLGNRMLIEGIELLSKLSTKIIYPLNNAGLFSLETDYQQIATDEWISLEYVPFGIGMTLSEEETDKYDEIESFSYKPTLALTLGIKEKFPLKNCQPLMEEFLDKTDENIVISIQTSTGSIDGLKLDGITYDLKPDNTIEMDNNNFGNTETILFMIDIPIFSQEIEKIKQHIEKSSKELSNLVSRLYQQKINS